MLRVVCVTLLAIAAVVLVSTRPADARPQRQRFHRTATHLEEDERAAGSLEARGKRRNKRLMNDQKGQVNAYAKRALRKTRTYTINSLITNVVYVCHD